MILSVVIPVYNEEKRIPKNIKEIFDFFGSLDGHEAEIIFVNDGSSDGTAEILKEFGGSYSFVSIGYGKNRGKGYAIRKGVEAATGDWIIFFDIDLATPLEAVRIFLNAKKDQDRIVIGSRRLDQSKIAVSESPLRVFLGQGFTRMSNILVPGITDFTCGFKCFSAPVAKKIFSLAKIDRWGFDTEILYIAKLHGFEIKQIPVSWRHDGDSKVRIIGAVWTSFCELVEMKLNQLRGYYK